MDIAKSFDYIKNNKEQCISEIANFIESDTILFWDNKQTIQKQKWESLLNLLYSKYKINAKISYNFLPADNNEAKQEYIHILNQLSDEELSMCILYSGILKSVLLGLLLAKKEISVQQGFEAAYLEELSQNERWGIDEQAENKRKEVLNLLYEIEDFFN